VDDVRVDRSLTIPGDELQLEFTPSSGPGGQHANRSSTRVELRWDVTNSGALTPRQRERVAAGLRHRLTAGGVLRLSSDTHRSQAQNRKEVVERLVRLVREALRPRRTRVATAPSAGSKADRVRTKRHRSAVKKLRRTPAAED
jgi:ribosome-associated protein